MLKLLLLLFFIKSFSISASPMNGTNFVCIEEQSTGFDFDEKSKTWEETRFKKSKYLLKRTTTKPNVTNDSLAPEVHIWEFTEFGNDSGKYCEQLKMISRWRDVVTCRSNTLQIVEINLKTLRFVRVYTGSYISDSANGGDSVVASIGTCAKL